MRLPFGLNGTLGLSVLALHDLAVYSTHGRRGGSMHAKGLVAAVILALAAVLAAGGVAEARPHYARHHLRTKHNAGGYYTNVDGVRVHRPIRASRPPAGWSARCRDGTYSFSLHRRGTCSRHGGVGMWR